MANHHHHPYGPAPHTYTSSSSIQSIVEQYVPTEPSYHTPSSIRQPTEARYTLGSGPPSVDADADIHFPLYSGYKRSSSDALYHPSHVGTHSAIGQSEGWYAANPSIKRPRFESSLPLYSSRPGKPDLKEMPTNVYANLTDTPTISLQSLLLEKEKLTGPNFLDWERNLRIVLKQERKLYTLDYPVPDHPPVNAPQGAIDDYRKHSDDSLHVTCLMLATMSPKLQERFEHVDAYHMIRLLQKMFQEHSRIERYETSQALYSCKMVKGASVSAHVMKMKRYIDRRARLGYPVAKELATDIILNSLSKDYKEFVINFDLNNMGLPFSELHEMLKDFEQNWSLNTKHKEVVVIRQGRENKNLDKGNSKIPAKKPNSKPKPNPKTKTKPKIKPEPEPEPKSKGKVAKDCVCHHCNVIGHWKRNCPLYLHELMEKKDNMANTSGVQDELTTLGRCQMGRCSRGVDN